MTVSRRDAPSSTLAKPMKYVTSASGTPADTQLVGGTLSLTDDANNWVYADAVRVAQPTGPSLLATADGEPLASGQTFDLGEFPQGTPAGTTISFVNAAIA